MSSTDGGRHFRCFLYPPGTFSSIDAAGSSTVFTVSNGVLYRSTDGGGTFQAVGI